MAIEALEKTYIYRDGRLTYMVSTINRESSAVSDYNSIYAETLAWDYEVNAEGNPERRDIVAQEEAPKDSLTGHDSVVRKLREEAGDD